MKFLRNIVLSALLLAASHPARGEGSPMLDSLLLRFNSYVSWCSPEKVYLHFDRTCYTAGETIWFKGWMQEASRRSVLPPSKFLYAEVLDDKGEAVARVKIKRTPDGFPGCIELPDNLETGDYTLRAYTLWQLNNSEEYLFNDRIRIIGIKVGAGKTPPTPAEDVEISFWPEGGRYFAGSRAVIGFKAVDKLGRSVDFQGQLLGDTDRAERHLFTVHDGMGAFSFVPKPGCRYSVRDAAGKMHPLPAPSEEGATLQLQVKSGRYYISTLGFGGGVADLLVCDDSELYLLSRISLDGKMNTLMLERPFFRPGINHFLLVDSHGKILSERLFFIRDTEAPVCQVEMDRFSSDRRAPVKGVITLMGPDGTPLDGDCSVSVVRGALKNWQQREGITSYMGLSSELKGRINDPFYYFDTDIPEPERNVALDLLMMIQGWRYYDLEQITDLSGGKIRLRYVREQMQEIRGHIARLLSSKVPKKFTFTFMIPRRNVWHSVDVEQGREFIIDSLDFPENTEMLINIGTSRLGAHYLPKWDGDPAAKPYLYKPAPGFAKSLPPEVPLEGPAADDTLQAAVVTASYADNDVLVFGRSFREDLETYKDMTLVEYLSMKKASFEYDGEYMYNRHRRRSDSFSSSESESEDGFDFEDEENESGRVKLIVDDSEEQWWGYDMLYLEDLRALSISTQPDPVFGGDGGAVHISIKPGSLRGTASRNPSLLYFVPLGYQIPRYFESPRYDQGEDLPYDDRNTLWWSPDLPVTGGRAPISFFNSDLMDYPYIIRVEGLTSDGRPFSRHCLVSPE
jgi:hypothetical protein